MKEPSLNVLDGPLQACSTAPLTGFFRDGCCNTGPQDRGLHTVCAVMTDEFLALSKYLGNDLSTPRPEYGFPGLKAGDRWCLCASRFLQAAQEGAAPQVRLAATHKATLHVVPLELLVAHALDAPRERQAPGCGRPGTHAGNVCPEGMPGRYARKRMNVDHTHVIRGSYPPHTRVSKGIQRVRGAALRPLAGLRARGRIPGP